MSTTQTPQPPPTDHAGPPALPSLIAVTVLLPVIGMIAGIAYFARNRPSEGVALWGTALLACVGWYVVLALIGS